MDSSIGLTKTIVKTATLHGIAMAKRLGKWQLQQWGPILSHKSVNDSFQRSRCTLSLTSDWRRTSRLKISNISSFLLACMLTTSGSTNDEVYPMVLRAILQVDQHLTTSIGTRLRTRIPIWRHGHKRTRPSQEIRFITDVNTLSTTHHITYHNNYVYKRGIQWFM